MRGIRGVVIAEGCQCPGEVRRGLERPHSGEASSHITGVKQTGSHRGPDMMQELVLWQGYLREISDL
jgi:hypothetical protein